MSVPRKVKEYTILHPRNQFQTHEGQECDQEYSAQMHKEKSFLTILTAFYDEIGREQ